MKFSEGEWQVLSEWLAKALELPADEREKWLDNLPDSCPVSKATLRDLLANDVEDGTESPLYPLPNLAEVDSSAGTGSSNFHEGKTIGAYRLIRELGRGGMGTVWLGERADGMLHRSIALKIPHAGVRGRHFLERFQREREILAGLAHPHIGRLYDAGVSAEGEPFLALEYIDGVELITYCDSKLLSVRQRLVLFLQILSAVQYAHTHLVVHRDLKPSNILVTADGQVKLLDFGIAKLMVDGTANETQLTQVAGRPLTPLYAAPEQLTGKPVSTISDVYSLGVLLYELLTGTHPYGDKSMSPVALEYAIVAADVVRPSQTATDTERARSRSTTAAKLASTLKGDIDTIILKALQKEPEQRYASADAFAQDVQRYLSGEAVLAQSESRWYRSKKFVVRNRVAVGAVVSVILALSAGLSVALWQSGEARAQARIAKREAQTAEAVQEFLEGIFAANASNQADPMKARQTTARELLDIGAARINSSLNDVPAAKLRILTSLSGMYNQLNLLEQQVDLDRKRVPLARIVFGPSHRAVVFALLDLASATGNQNMNAEAEQALADAGIILDRNKDFTSVARATLEGALAERYLTGDFSKAREHAEKAVQLMRAFAPMRTLAQSLNTAGTIYLKSGDYRNAQAVAEEALSVANSIAPQANSAISRAYEVLGEAQEGQEDLANAEKSYQSAAAASRKYFGPQTVMTFISDYDLAYFLQHTSRLSQSLGVAMPACDMALTFKKRGITASILSHGWVLCGSVLMAHGRLKDGFAALQQAERLRENLDPLLTLNARVFEERSVGLMETGRYAEAKALLEQSLKIHKGLRREGTTFYNRNVLYRSRALSMLGYNDEALHTLKEYRMFAAPPGRVSRSWLEELVTRSEVNLRKGDTDVARGIAAEARMAITTSVNRPYLATWEARAALVEGRAELKVGNARTAVSLVQRAVELRTELLDPMSPALADAQVALANCYLELGDRAKASGLYTQANGIHRQHAELGEHYQKPLRDLGQRVPKNF